MALIDGLASYYPLDGDSLDAHGANDGTDTVVGYEAAQIGSGAFGSTVASQIAVSIAAGTTFSLSFWVQPDASQSALTQYGRLLGADANNALFIQHSAGVLTLQLWIGGALKSNTVVVDATWYHVVMTADGVTVRLYVDNVEVWNGASAPNWTISTLLYQCTATADEVGIWTRAITVPEVAELWNAGAGNAYPFTLPAPVATSITPATGLEAGGTAVVIAGTDFVAGATVTIGGVAALSVQVNSAIEIECTTPPGYAGARDVVVTNPDTQSDTLVGGFLYTVAAAVFTPWGSTIAKLLPPGKLWDLEPNSLLQRLTVAIGDEFARVQARAVDLVEETDPRTADETIADWERVLALPDEIVTAIPATLAARRVAVTSKYVGRAGQNLAYFTTLCAACGYSLVSITKYAGDGLARVGDRIGTRLYGTAFAYSILITVTDTASPPALTHTQFEAVVRHHTHSHITVMFTYV